MFMTAANPNHRANLLTAGKMGDRPPEALRPDEVAALLAAAAYRAHPVALGPRNQAMIIVWWRAGLRLSESLALRTTDVDLRGGTIRVRDGKGHVSRTVGIDPTAALVLARWLDVRRNELGLPKNRGPLFCQVNGKSLTASAAQNMLKRCARRAGVGDRRVHPHALRHTHAVELVREGVNVALIQRQLGHAHLNTTAEYLRDLQPDEVINRVAQRRWTPAALAQVDVDDVVLPGEDPMDGGDVPD
jgi:site-specific recombinase XerD